MKVNSLWNPPILVQSIHSPAGVGVVLPQHHFAVNPSFSGQSSKFKQTFRMPGVFRFDLKAADKDDVVIHNPWGGIVPTDESIEERPAKQPTRPPEVDITTIIEQRKRKQDEDDQRSWDNVLRIPVESPEDRARWIEEQKRREDAKKGDRRDERGIVIIDYSV